jgi:hypothetical protein
MSVASCSVIQNFISIMELVNNWTSVKRLVTLKTLKSKALFPQTNVKTYGYVPEQIV